MARRVIDDTKALARVLTLLRKGNTREHSALAAGISVDTLARRIRDNAEFAEAVTRAEAEGITRRVGTLESCIDGAFKANDFATAGRLTIEYLKRRDRANWGDNVAIDVDAEVARTLSQLASLNQEAIPDEIAGGAARSEGEGAR